MDIGLFILSAGTVVAILIWFRIISWSTITQSANRFHDRLIAPLARAFHLAADHNHNAADAIESSASSSSLSCAALSCPPTIKHDVFLSFRGEDTRDNFTSHLYEALSRNKIRTYIDYKLDKGDEISPSLLKAIEESEISVVIFSRDYASSTWCLDELVKILECKKNYGRVVIPVFYNIDPSNVRKIRGTYADAFVKHKHRFKDNLDKVERWKLALFQAAGLSGWDSTKTRPEAELVRRIVRNILEKLDCLSSCNLEGLVGIHEHIAEVEALLGTESPDVGIVGIWGMGGIGKTTVAEVIYHRLKAQFESRSFVANVREQLTRNGLDHLRNKCLSELLEDKDIGDYSIRSATMKDRLQCRKILLVLDDVDNAILAEDLIKCCEWFGVGSRIIITSRDLQVLKNVGARRTHHIQKMNFHDALQLFSFNAFKQNHPPDDHLEEFSKRMVRYCQGIPLALKVMGSFLYGRTEEEWKSSLQSLEKGQKKEIFDVLKLSFDGLEDEQKKIFLDLACFFRGIGKPHMDDVPHYYDSSAYIGIRVLIDRSLIAIKDGQIVLHDLVEEMGQEVVRKQFVNEPGKPIRLWKHEDIYSVLKNNWGAETIECISLDMCKIRKIYLKSDSFEKMYNLRFLDFYKSDLEGPSNVYISEGLESLPDELKILRWWGYPLQSLPLSFCSENLVELVMPESNLQQLWNGDQHFPNLQVIDLRYSSHLQQLWTGDQHFPNLKVIDLWCSRRLLKLPDLSKAPNIEEINLLGCTSLRQLNSLSSLVKLRVLSLDLPDKPNSLEFLPVRSKLRYFAWLKCPLRSLPINLWSENLVSLDMHTSHLEQPWDGDLYFPKLETINLSDCKHLVGLPDLAQAPNIREIHLRRCTSLLQVYSSRPLAKLRYSYFNSCDKLRRINLPGKIHRRSSGLVAVYNYFDLQDFSFTKVAVWVSQSVLRLKAVSFPFTEITESWDGVDKAELRLLGERLASLLPFLTKLRWLEVPEALPSIVGNLSEDLELQLSYDHLRELSIVELLSKSPKKIMEPTKSLTHPCTKGTVLIREVPFSLEQSTGLKSLTELGYRGGIRLSRIPTDTGRFSLLTQFSLQKGDIVSLPAVSIPGLPSLKSLASCHYRRLQSNIQVAIVENPTLYWLIHSRRLSPSTTIYATFSACESARAIAFSFCRYDRLDVPPYSFYW